MQIIANALLNMAKSIAKSSGSGLEIRVKENTINVKFVPKENTDKRVWENYYKNAAIYIKDSANPVKINVNRDNIGNLTVDNLVASSYYASVMRMDSIKKMYGVSGSKDDMIEKLMYACLAGIAVIALLIIGTA
ncbi:hypothetical protein [Methanohalobium sp.]|uniref:hypothetical protein n=1 Tax=Methanohalobium sp. TaxID=2837493 RepID=UPI0025F3C08F|nr:hypothetical protein [Methanohalobium sp.]